jgi:hypothetical protein
MEAQCLRRRYRQILLGGSGGIADDLSNEVDWLSFFTRNRRKRIASSLSTSGNAQRAFFGKPVTIYVDVQISGSVLGRAPSNDDYKSNNHHDAGRDISETSINCRRQRRRQIGVEHALNS